MAVLAQRLDGPWHGRALPPFVAVVLAHWAERLAQALRVYVLHWPEVGARGVLGLWFPLLVDAEVLHYGSALVRLVGLWALRTGFVGRAWWMVAFCIRFWHHIEHLRLQGQVVAGRNLFDAPVPTSLAQLVLPRVELHTLYACLNQLERKGFVRWRLDEPAEERGGHARRFYRVTASGVRAVKAARDGQLILWRGLEGVLGPTR